MTKADKTQDAVDTTGHEWDGIKEFNNPLPRWWLWTFYATIFWGVAYTIAYPAWPGIKAATPGLLGYSTRAEVAEAITAVDTANAEITARLAATELTAVADDEDLAIFARQAGAAVFQTWCAQCHGEGAAGVQKLGYPNLLDDDWLWGGDINAIHQTISQGIRVETHDDTRYSEMPAFGDILAEEEIAQVVNFVLDLSGQTPLDPQSVAAGAVLYADNCAACHADDGTGDRTLGAPDLTDAIWLFGGTFETLTEAVSNARYGVMPGWEGRLSEADLRAVTVYVHGLGGGEVTE